MSYRTIHDTTSIKVLRHLLTLFLGGEGPSESFPKFPSYKLGYESPLFMLCSLP